MTTNGSQHLCALMRDETTAEYVNLVKTKYPGDLYTYISNKVWEDLQNEISTFSKKYVNELETFIDNFIEYKKAIHISEARSEVRREAVENILEFKRANAQLVGDACCVFWNRITDNKERRKIIKR